MSGLTFLEQHFTFIHVILVLILFFFGFTFLTKRGSKSQFKVREYDRVTKHRTQHHHSHHKAKPAQKALPPAFKASKHPHEVLGIKKDATEKQIQKAYRTLMKRYHPDKFVNLDPDQIKEYEKIAVAINKAKDEMLSQLV